MGVLRQPVDACVAIGGERRDGGLHERMDAGALPGGAAGTALPAGGLERQILRQRTRNFARLACRRDLQEALVEQAAALAAQLLVLLCSDRMVEIADASSDGRQHRARMLAE